MVMGVTTALLETDTADQKPYFAAQVQCFVPTPSVASTRQRHFVTKHCTCAADSVLKIFGPKTDFAAQVQYLGPSAVAPSTRERHHFHGVYARAPKILLLRAIPPRLSLEMVGRW